MFIDQAIGGDHDVVGVLQAVHEHFSGIPRTTPARQVIIYREETVRIVVQGDDAAGLFRDQPEEIRAK